MYEELESIVLESDLAQEFIDHRITQLQQALFEQPYVFIAGHTGVGKSTFIQKYLNNHEVLSLYIGEAQIKNWANDTSSKIKFLFIDEANLQDTDWSIFEDLHNQSPSIFYKGEYYPLNPNHKVIFAGNPASYGNRKIPELFKKHENIIVFDVMPASYIYCDILWPILDDLEFENTPEICKIFLQAYQFIASNFTKDHILISPRELKTMALLFKTHFNETADKNSLALYSCYTIAKQTLSATQQNIFSAWFKESFGEFNFDAALPQLDPQQFVITNSHQPAWNALNSCLKIRELRKASANNPLLAGDLSSALIFEGPSGAGKSDF